MADNKNDLYEQEQDLLRHLRQESRDVKQCFTTYSYQALIFSSAVLGSLLATMDKYPMVVFASIPVIVFLMIICRTGIFKYSTANRIYGYELHLDRLRYINSINQDSCVCGTKDIYRLIGWEEAQRAWRIVQTAIFRRFYKTPDEEKLANILRSCGLGVVNYFRPDLYGLKREVKKLRKRFKCCVGNIGGQFSCNNSSCDSYKKGLPNTEQCKDYPWFLLHDISACGIDNSKSNRKSESNGESRNIVDNKSTYHAGSYLKNILGVLILMQWLLLIPLCILIISNITQPPQGRIGNPPIWLCTVVLCFMSMLIICRKIRIDSRRKILENELLSIHSCSIVWHAVVLAHYCAAKKTKGTLRNYTQYLTVEATSLRDEAYMIHDWIRNKSNELFKRSSSPGTTGDGH